jgi:hypothetical protein
MANEALLRDRFENAIDFTCADGTGIEKGALLKLTDPRTAIISTAAADKLAGIAGREKIASDGRTQIAVYRRGIFDMVASGAIAVGEAVQSAASTGFSNTIMKAAVTSSGACILGYALETASDAETIQILVDVGCGGNQIS